MDWANEDYVRVYTRETPDDIDLSWEALALWRALLLKFDRSGLLPVRSGWASVARLIRWPVDVVERVGPELVRDGRVRSVEAGLFAPNYIAAQTASKSDKQRQRDSRERRRAEAEAMQDVDITDIGHVSSQEVTPESQAVTNGHAKSLSATLCSADPLLRVATLSEAIESPPKPAETSSPALNLVPGHAPKARGKRKTVACTDEERASVEAVLARLSEQSGVEWGFCDTHARLILARLRSGITEWDLRVIIGYCSSPKAAGGKGWRGDEKMAEYLRPSTLFGPEKVHEYLAPARAWYAKYVDDGQPKGPA